MANHELDIVQKITTMMDKEWTDRISIGKKIFVEGNWTRQD